MPRHEPERTCIVTRETRAPGDLLRFVLDPEGRVVPDLASKLPGRGAWLTPTAEAVRLALKRKAFGRAFKTEVKVSPAFADEVDALLVRDLRGALGLAAKAGAVVTGFGKVEAAIAGGEAAALIHAREAAEDGRRKLAAALRRTGDATTSRLPVYDDLSEHELDMALGRVHVIHAALLAGPGSSGCLARWRRLRFYRGLDGGADAPRGMSDQTGQGGPSGSEQD